MITKVVPRTRECGTLSDTGRQVSIRAEAGIRYNAQVWIFR
jgi:hypothetical protein